MSSESEGILQERARRLAARAAERDETAGLQVLLFRLGGEQYALELGALQSVQGAEGLTPVPCTPPSIAGILNVRGEILSVLALRALLGLPPEAGEQGQVILMESRRGRIGVLVDEVVSVERVATERITRSFSGKEYARGIVDGTIALIDPDSLLGSEVEVEEDVG